ncbi:hypothetical protein K2X05_07080 [bacterium]|nr:hypothetical protein [bacterium]
MYIVIVSLNQNGKFEAIALFGSPIGIKQLLRTLPPNEIAVIVGSSLRPQYNSELSELAEKYSLPYLIQPLRSSSNYPMFLKTFVNTGCKSLVSHTYSMRIGSEILNSVKRTAANIHYSLLPRNRGPNPIQWALIKGEKKIGTTLHLMDEDFDTGQIITQVEFDITPEDTWTTLMEKCHQKTENLLLSIFSKLQTGTYTTYKQNDSISSTNKRLNPNYPKIDFYEMTDLQIFNLIRSQVEPLKGAYVEISDVRHYINRIVALKNIPLLRKQFGDGKIIVEDLYEES